MVVDRIECNLDKPGSNTYDTNFAGIHASLQGPDLMDFSMY